jgi:hypothetical protein
MRNRCLLDQSKREQFRPLVDCILLAGPAGTATGDPFRL